VTAQTASRRAPAGRPASPARRWRRRVGWALPVLLLVGAAWAVVLTQPGAPVPAVGTVAERVARLAGDLAGAGREQQPAYADPVRLLSVARLALETVAMSVLAIGLAALGALASVPLAARVLTVGELGPGRWRTAIAFHVARAAHVVTRSVPEVVWALLVVLLVPPGVLAGALALALHEVGVLGRLGADLVDDVDRAPLRALRATGAGRFALLGYGVLPAALPQLVTVLLYRWEVTVRASVVVGFLTAAGLGYQLRLDLSFRRWTDVALVLLTYLLLVWAVDAVSSGLRRLAR
jgi:phosphonate transport system permease protein